MIIPSVSAVLHRNGKYVVVFSNKRDGRPILPGGKIELGETPVQACVRETYEETGLTTCFNFAPHAKRVHVGTDGKHYRSHVFRNEVAPSTRVSGTHDEGPVGWLTLAQLRAQSPFGPLYTDSLMGIRKMPAQNYHEGTSHVSQSFPFVITPTVRKQLHTLLEFSFSPKSIDGRSVNWTYHCNDGKFGAEVNTYESHIYVTVGKERAVVRRAFEIMREMYGIPGSA